jgi:hypothetical protein
MIKLKKVNDTNKKKNGGSIIYTELGAGTWYLGMLFLLLNYKWLEEWWFVVDQLSLATSYAWFVQRVRWQAESFSFAAFCIVQEGGMPAGPVSTPLHKLLPVAVSSGTGRGGDDRLKYKRDKKNALSICIR